MYTGWLTLLIILGLPPGEELIPGTSISYMSTEQTEKAHGLYHVFLLIFNSDYNDVADCKGNKNSEEHNPLCSNIPTRRPVSTKSSMRSVEQDVIA